MRTIAFPQPSTLALGIVAVVLVGCGNGDGDQQGVIRQPEVVANFYRHTSLQCQPSQSTPANLSALATTFANAGVSVAGIKCGYFYEYWYPASCGGITDEIWVVSTVNASAQTMHNLGFDPVAQVPTAVVDRACTGGA